MAERKNKRDLLSILGWVFIGLVFVFLLMGIGASILMGKQGKGPLANLADPSATFSPTVRMSPTLYFTFTPTYTATQSPTPTVTGTPTPVRPVGSFQINDADGMKLFYIPQDAFMMGWEETDSEEIQAHKVYLDGYWIDETEVTNEMYARFLNEVGNIVVEGELFAYLEQDEYDQLYIEDGIWMALEGYEKHPVAQVTWFGAEAYCEWAGRRLPTEAEWEKAAKGLSGFLYPWGESPAAGNLLNFADLNTTARFADESIDDGFAETAPVGSYPDGASEYGLLDMAGNVKEWVADWYDKNYYANSPAKNPQGPENGELRVLRGGGWYDSLLNSSTVHRMYQKPVYHKPFIGFRCASDPD